MCDFEREEMWERESLREYFILRSKNKQRKDASEKKREGV